MKDFCQSCLEKCLPVSFYHDHSKDNGKVEEEVLRKPYKEERVNEMEEMIVARKPQKKFSPG